MGHTRRRPFTGVTPAGVNATYIVVEASLDDTSITVDPVGAATFTVDYTLDNILFDTAAQAAWNLSMANDPGRYVDPGDALFTNVIASGAVQAVGSVANIPIFAIRINQTAGAGSVRYAITQG